MSRPQIGIRVIHRYWTGSNFGRGDLEVTPGVLAEWLDSPGWGPEYRVRGDDGEDYFGDWEVDIFPA